MHGLRKLLDDIGSVQGLRGEEKDPEEFLNLLLVDVLNAEPPILLRFDLANHSFTSVSFLSLHVLSYLRKPVFFKYVQQ